MSAFTLRLEPELAKKLDQVCREQGYKKTGLVMALIRDFLEKEDSVRPIKQPPQQDLKKLVGIVSLGGDAVEDADAYFE